MTPLHELLKFSETDPLLGSVGFTNAAFRALVRRAGTVGELKVFEAALVASIWNGPEPPSVKSAYLAASSGAALQASIAAGLLSTGAKHGCAGSLAAKWIRDAVAAAKSPDAIIASAGGRLAGLGHKVYDHDPRAMGIRDLAKASGLDPTPFDILFAVGESLSAAKNRPLHPNIDGAIGALAVVLGAEDQVADAIFLIGRSVGAAVASFEGQGMSSYERKGAS